MSADVRPRPSNLARYHAVRAEQRRAAEAPVMAMVEGVRARGGTWTECVEAVTLAGHLSPLGVPYSYPALVQAHAKWRKRRAAA